MKVDVEVPYQIIQFQVSELWFLKGVSQGLGAHIGYY
jgi:hypothetical protein